MKSVAFALIVMFILCLTFHTSTAADSEGPSVSGRFQISNGNAPSLDIRFDARMTSDGNTSGEITFRAVGETVTDSNATGDAESSESLPPFYAKASCDCLVVNGVEAVMSGTVTESSRKNFIGRRVLLVAQDGDRFTPALRDKLTYGFYRTMTYGFGATDGERPEDQEVPGWVATDAERPDDVGVLSKKNEEVTCTSFPITSHSFLGAKQGKGKIQITR